MFNKIITILLIAQVFNFASTSTKEVWINQQAPNLSEIELNKQCKIILINGQFIPAKILKVESKALLIYLIKKEKTYKLPISEIKKIEFVKNNNVYTDKGQIELEEPYKIILINDTYIEGEINKYKNDTLEVFLKKQQKLFYLPMKEVKTIKPDPKNVTASTLFIMGTASALISAGLFANSTSKVTKTTKKQESCFANLFLLPCEEPKTYTETKISGSKVGYGLLSGIVSIVLFSQGVATSKKRDDLKVNTVITPKSVGIQGALRF